MCRSCLGHHEGAYNPQWARMHRLMTERGSKATGSAPNMCDTAHRCVEHYVALPSPCLFFCGACPRLLFEGR